ncbi:MAG: cysteine desulfurase [Bacteroidetes bacterium]|nr:cysteine desulfurase [Bacteroidota bacterium]
MQPWCYSWGFDVAKIRENFPILSTKVYGKPLVYFDNAATSQKPQQVIDRLVKYYQEENSNVHRGIYYLSELASAKYEEARDVVRTHLNANSLAEIIFVRGATEGINLVANSWGKHNIVAGDEVIISAMEHHANLVPWQQLCKEKGATLKVIPIDDNGEIIFEEYKNLLSDKTKIVAVAHTSNGIGTINPIKEIIAEAHKKNIPVLVDGCQASPHFKVDVKELDCDFYVFSGHKTFAPTGIGVLYGKENLLDAMPPYQMGGEMIKFVSFTETTFNDLPIKFEAATPNIAGAIGLATAIEYVDSLGRNNIENYEEDLKSYALQKLQEVKNLKLIGNAKNRIPLFSFVVEGTHPLDLGTMLDFEGIAIRTGNHCAQPLMQRMGVAATCRASLAFYNTKAEVDYFVDSLNKVVKKLIS